MDILQDLEKRGLIQQVTNEEGLKSHLKETSVKLYCGFDPTGDSLHIGHLLPVTMLKRFQEAGHKPIALIGGGTGMIGDPSGRSSERSLNTAETVKGYADALTNQLSQLLDVDDSGNGVLARNNHDWLSQMSVIDFLRDAGKHFTVNYMLAKDAVSSRIEDGISYTEFSYMLLQSIDYLRLYEEEGVSLQIGGSDQWGNITAGLEFIRRSTEEEEVKAYGLTVPLITKADGTKFGKTAGGAVWLDPEKTSPYEFYQFWYNTDDRDVLRFLNYFTFLTHEELDQIAKETESDPGARIAQKKLAEEITTFVHGKDALNRAIKISEALFKGDIKQLSVDEIKEGFKDVPTFETNEREGNLVDLLVQAKISPSKRQAREDIKNGAIYINGERNQDIDHTMNDSDRLEETFTVIRRGRRKYSLVRYI